MNRKNSDRDWGGLIFAIKAIIVVGVFVAFVYYVDESDYIRRNPSYLRLESLADEATTSNNNLVRAMDASSPDSIGLSPINEQIKTNKAFSDLAKAAEVTKTKFVSRRVRQMLKDGPRKLIELPKGDTDRLGSNIQ